jgi:dipeptidyl aminopeptidase/acylaminoacyl peptidase
MEGMTDSFTALLETKSAHMADIDDGSTDRSWRVLVRSDLTGTMQLYELDQTGALRQITDLAEPVGVARYLPGGDACIVSSDEGGNERHQLYRIDLKAARSSEPLALGDLVSITAEPRFGHQLCGVSPTGNLVAYVSNKHNGIDFDLWTCDLVTSEHRLLLAQGSWLQPGSGFSPDGRWLSVLRPGPRPLDSDMLLVAVDSGEVREIQPHPDQPAIVDPPAWIGSTSFFFASNVERDFSAVMLHDLETGETTRFGGTGETCDARPVTSGDGSTLLVIENRNGTNVLTLYGSNPVEPTGGTEVPLAETGVVENHLIRGPELSRDGSTVFYTLSTPRLAGDVWAFDADTQTTKRLTSSPSAISPEQLVRAEVTETPAFDGERIPLYVYRPSGSEHPPVVVFVHGGPESQSTLAFLPVIQGLVSSGYAVVVPNVRGSTGYGKRYASLDDTTKRLDSVHDLASVRGWLESAGLDATRAALWGGSYGGYMVLAGLAFQPELWAAGVDIVGISDLVTFLENTSDYRRAHREREYGSLANDRAFLEKASPLRRADEIVAPLFVIHGRNDPRVPVSEAEQLTASLTARGVACELVIYEDEGHGLARLANKLDAYPRALHFLNEVMRDQ